MIIINYQNFKEFYSILSIILKKIEISFDFNELRLLI